MKISDNLVEFGGVIYYIDLEALENSVVQKNEGETYKVETTEVYKDKDGKIDSVKVITTIGEKDPEVNINKLDILRYLLENILDNEEELDDSLGHDFAMNKAKLGFKISLNTLLNEGVIKQIQI